MKVTRSVWILAAAALGAAAAGFYLARQLDRGSPQLASGTWYPQPRAVAGFELRDAAGEPFTRASLQGRPTLVFFGFTHCPDVCPTTLLKLAQVRRQVAPAPLRVLFISVDPQRDGPQALGEYVHALTRSSSAPPGRPRSSRALASGFGVAVNRGAARRGLHDGSLGGGVPAGRRGQHRCHLHATV
jgi:protein SCO1/2